MREHMPRVPRVVDFYISIWLIQQAARVTDIAIVYVHTACDTIDSINCELRYVDSARFDIHVKNTYTSSVKPWYIYIYMSRHDISLIR